MRRLLTALVGAAAFVGGSSAGAVVFKTEINQAALDSTNSSNFGAILDNETDPFSISSNFLVDETSLGSSSITAVFDAMNDIDFSSITLDGMAFTQSGFDPDDETFFITLAGPLNVGLHTITVNGIALSGDGAFGGNLTLSNAVPEPGTWMMMLLGFGGIGLAVRRRRKPALAQLA